MAGQGPSRRELLQALSLASIASAFSGFDRWHFAFAEQPTHDHSMGDAQPVQISKTYQPQFFSSAQYATLDAITELILPRDTSPGARDAGVAEFIDFMVKNDATLQSPFIQGLQTLDGLAAPDTFLTLSHAAQIELLSRLAYKSKYRSGEEAGQKFFKLTREYTVMGYYTTRIGLQALDYPGLKFYAASPGCTHLDNPEHAGLREHSA